MPHGSHKISDSHPSKSNFQPPFGVASGGSTKDLEHKPTDLPRIDPNLPRELMDREKPFPYPRKRGNK